MKLVTFAVDGSTDRVGVLTEGDAERVYGNVAALYREFRNDTSAPEIMPVFAEMARIHKEVIVPRQQG